MSNYLNKNWVFQFLLITTANINSIYIRLVEKFPKIPLTRDRGQWWGVPANQGGKTVRRKKQATESEASCIHHQRDASWGQAHQIFPSDGQDSPRPHLGFI